MLARLLIALGLARAPQPAVMPSVHRGEIALSIGADNLGRDFVPAKLSAAEVERCFGIRQPATSYGVALIVPDVA